MGKRERRLSMAFLCNRNKSTIGIAMNMSHPNLSLDACGGPKAWRKAAEDCFPKRCLTPSIARSAVLHDPARMVLRLEVDLPRSVRSQPETIFHFPMARYSKVLLAEPTRNASTSARRRHAVRDATTITTGPNNFCTKRADGPKVLIEMTKPTLAA